MVDIVSGGAVPAVFEMIAETPDRPCWFPTVREAQMELVDNMITRLQEFLDGERDFEDAVTLEEYVVPAEILENGTVKI